MASAESNMRRGGRAGQGRGNLSGGSELSSPRESNRPIGLLKPIRIVLASNSATAPCKKVELTKE